MAAPRRHMRLVGRTALEAAPRLVELDFELVEEGPLGFRGGQFVILDTGLELDPSEPGKHLKRAFTIASSDRDQRRFRVIVLDVHGLDVGAQGRGSRALCGLGPEALELGSVLEFGGPWGKVFGDGLAPPARRLFVATDNGLTAALGFLNSEEQAGCLESIELLWFRPEEWSACPGIEGFLPEGLGCLRVLDAAPVGHPGRSSAVEQAVLAHAELGGAATYASAWLVGDGDVVVPLGAALEQAGLAASALRRIECFFHAPGS